MKLTANPVTVGSDNNLRMSLVLASPPSFCIWIRFLCHIGHCNRTCFTVWKPSSHSHIAPSSCSNPGTFREWRNARRPIFCVRSWMRMLLAGLCLLCSPRTFLEGSVISIAWRSFPVFDLFHCSRQSGKREALICL